LWPFSKWANEGLIGLLMGFKSFEPLKVLQELQHVTIFSQLVSPPFDFGTTWSSVKRFLSKISEQY
jgi:hypothetical protein